MGLPTDEKNFLRDAFGEAFKNALYLDKQFSVAIVDFMQYVKFVPDDVKTVNDAVKYFGNFVRDLITFRNGMLRKIILLVDGKPLAVKKMVCHSERYHEDKIKVREYVEGKPVLPLNPTAPLNTEKWIEFAGNYQLLQRELYPLLFNEFMFNCTVQQGQQLILSGFPGQSWYETVHSNRPWEAQADSKGRVLQVQAWRGQITPEMEEKDKDLYHRVYVVEHVGPSPQYPTGALLRYEWEEAKNDISEADVRLFYFEHWFQHDNILFSINDGDIFSIGLLYAYERHMNTRGDGTYEFRNEHVVMMKHKDTDKERKEREAKGIYIKPSGKTFLDLNVFYRLVRDYEPFRLGHVQNPIASMVFLLIMAGTDFFKRPKNISGAVIRRVFFDNISVFSHLVQLSTGVSRDTRTERHVILDEDLFRRFVNFCYLEKYEPGMLTKLKQESVTFNQLQQRTKEDAKGNDNNDTALHMPTRNMVRIWTRQVLWNLLYWKNGVFGLCPDPFEMWHGVPYYPYWINPEDKKPMIIDCVSAKVKPVDRVYSQHFIRAKKRERDAPSKEERMESKRRVVEELEYMIRE